MLNHALEFTSSTRHFTRTLRALQYTKLDRVMLFTRQTFVSECHVTLELYRTVRTFQL